MKAVALALLFVASFAHAQEIPPKVFQELVQRDADREFYAVTCQKKRPYVCVEKHQDSTTTYKELPGGRERVVFCYWDQDKRAKACQLTTINRPARRTRDLNPPKIDPNEPNHWEYMARVAVMPLMDAVEYEQHLATIYSAALEPCYNAKLKGIDDVILWLGRVDKKGRLVKTWVGTSSPFADCFSKNMKVGMMVSKPPQWDNVEAEKEGYPIRYEWNVRLLQELWQKRAEAASKQQK